MEIRFTRHARDKMQLFELSEREVIKGIEDPELRCRDTEKHSMIYIFKRDGRLYSVVMKGGAVITIYRTDEKRLSSRRRSGRWSCY